jgi:hypothetical protein
MHSFVITGVLVLSGCSEGARDADTLPVDSGRISEVLDAGSGGGDDAVAAEVAVTASTPRNGSRPEKKSGLRALVTTTSK